ncbi:uncharacterized protein LOC124418202 [Gallus gallus]|uniref:uncharacterized protein LOC124418202 n=1 Tax=Gallus gallus TaxID=9031 RepID=UPI001F0112DD|nr:uncharacterized protein LOC124418202 [Gallus gallus]
MLQNEHRGLPGKCDLGTAWLSCRAQCSSTFGVGFPWPCCSAGANCSRHRAVSPGRSLRWMRGVPTAAGWSPAQPLSALCLRSAAGEHKAEASPAANPGLKAKAGLAEPPPPRGDADKTQKCGYKRANRVRAAPLAHPGKQLRAKPSSRAKGDRDSGIVCTLIKFADGAELSGAADTRRRWSCWSGPEEGQEDDQRAAAPRLQGQSESTGAVQPGEEKALRRASSSIPVWKGGLEESCGELVRRAGSDRMQGNGFEVGECRFRPDTGKRFLTVKHWDRLPSVVVNAPSLEAFKARLDGAVSSLVSREVSLPAAGGWNEVISEAPSKTNHSVNL